MVLYETAVFLGVTMIFVSSGLYTLFLFFSIGVILRRRAGHFLLYISCCNLLCGEGGFSGIARTSEV
jgi:hypothetical protein